jgi:hypothetical protein
MANAHVLISSQTLGSAVTSVTFGLGGTLSQAYRDLRLVIVARSSGSSTDYVNISFNGDTGSNYSRVQMYGDGSTYSSSATSSNIVQGTIPNSTSASTDVGVCTIDIMDYSATDKHKTFLTRNSRATTEAFAQASRWANTAAITSVTFTTYTGSTYAAGSSFYLYGVLA